METHVSEKNKSKEDVAMIEDKRDGADWTCREMRACGWRRGAHEERKLIKKSRV